MEGYSVLVKSLFISPPLNYFSLYTVIENRLLRVSFIKQFDFIIYQHQTRELTFYHQPPPKQNIYATSLIMFALPISKPRFKNIIFNQNIPKIKLFLQKMQNFRALEAKPPDPRASGGWGLCPQTPKTAPPLRISGYAPGSHKGYVLFVCCWPAPNSGQKSY